MVFFFFKQKTAYEMRISDWSSDVCSSDLHWRCGHSRCNRGRTFHSGRIVAGRRDVPDVRMAGLETAPRLRLADLPARFVDDQYHLRSAESRVGKEGVSECRYGWAQDH